MSVNKTTSKLSVMSTDRPASFVNALLTGVITSLALTAGCPEIKEVRANFIAGEGVVGQSVRSVADFYSKAIGQSQVNSTTAGGLPLSFVGLLAGFVGSYVIDKVWLLTTGKAPENQGSNFTSFVQTAVISAAVAPIIIPLTVFRLPPFNPAVAGEKKGVKFALLFAGAKLASQGLYQQLILDEALGG